ncbi:CalY family protein [Sediminivirga luteola]|nr:CalY family protein [Sediminivirga luteola]
MTTAQWQDDATISGDVTTGTFEITVDPSDLGFDDDFGPGDTQSGTYTLLNESSVDAYITLDISGFTATDVWDLEVTADGEPVFEGDPAGAGTTDLALSTDSVFGPNESASIGISLTLVDPETGSAPEGVTDTATFTFNGTSEIPTDDGPGPVE